MHLKYMIVRICLLWVGMFGNVKDGFLKHARYERYKRAPSPKLRGSRESKPSDSLAPLLCNLALHLSAWELVACLLVGSSVANTEHVLPDEGEEVFQRAE